MWWFPRHGSNLEPTELALSDSTVELFGDRVGRNYTQAPRAVKRKHATACDPSATERLPPIILVCCSVSNTESFVSQRVAEPRKMCSLGPAPAKLLESGAVRGTAAKTCVVYLW